MNKTMCLVLGVVASLSLALPLRSAQAVDADSADARAIMVAVREQLSPTTGLSRMKMTIRQGKSTRERMMVVRLGRFGAARKSLILIESPADVRNTGFLTVDYDEANRADEQWIYLPALHRVSRVPNSGKADSFVGSDFSISDLSGQDPQDYHFKILKQSTKVGGEECWLIESVPRTEDVKEKTGYRKAHIWVSKEKLVPLQTKAWPLDTKKTKYFKATDIRKVDGLWTAHRLQMRTLEDGGEPSETVIDVTAVKNNAPEVTEADFTQQHLERGI